MGCKMLSNAKYCNVVLFSYIFLFLLQYLSIIGIIYLHCLFLDSQFVVKIFSVKAKLL